VAILLGAGALGQTAEHKLPLLTLLLISEFGFFVCAAGLGFGISFWEKTQKKAPLLLLCVGCLLLMALFAFCGLNLWSGSVSQP
jgi:purine-cytosine permease-like protein